MVIGVTDRTARPGLAGKLVAVIVRVAGRGRTILGLGEPVADIVAGR
jgi:hypothetical protein